MTETSVSTQDLVGLGFGPSNLALAVALDEQKKYTRVKFIEQRPEFSWHPGMMIEGAGVQNSYLKDLVTLRNPTSRYTFLSYLKEKGRLHRFINLSRPFATRWEFNDYFRWVAEHFEGLVDYGWKVVRVAPDADPDGLVRTLVVTARNAQGEERSLHTRNIVLGLGGRPNLLPEIVPESHRVLHSSQFLDKFADRHPDRNVPISVAVLGGGQSGAEITHFINREYPRSTVHWIVSEAAPKPADDTPFVNAIFMEDEVDRHYGATHEQGDFGYHDSLRSSNYGVADVDLLYSLYRAEYDGIARGNPRLHVHTRTRLTSAFEEDGQLTLKCGGQAPVLRVDSLLLATGYDRGLPPEIASELLPLLQHDDQGRLVVERDYRLTARPELTAGVYVQGMAEHSHGLGDTLLPVMPFRSARIAEQVAAVDLPVEIGHRT